LGWAEVAEAGQEEPLSFCIREGLLITLIRGTQPWPRTLFSFPFTCESVRQRLSPGLSRVEQEADHTEKRSLERNIPFSVADA
jgi:hypothetical protein